MSDNNPMTFLTDRMHFNRIRNTLYSLVGSNSYRLEIGIENYPAKIIHHYQQFLSGDLVAQCNKAEIQHAFGFENFGLIVHFEKPTTLKLHSQEMELCLPIKKLIEEFGVIFFSNACLRAEIADMGHKNNFPHLNFHRDRHDTHENIYSLYTRNPDDPEQQEPRKASTLFIDNAVAYLQAKVENKLNPDEKGRRGTYDIFKNTEIDKLFGTVLLEQAWSAPSGYGEVGAINNFTVLHSSYKHGFDPGYRIGARYLS
ncbi:hypothetical protein AADZ91_03245 [Colwelliaceae bacterium 6441]